MWDLTLNEQERMISDSLRDFLTREMPIGRLRPARSVVSPTDWRVMGELGYLAVGLPEAAGGAGLGIVEEVLVQRECGRQLLSPSILAVVIGAHVAAHAEDLDLARTLAAGKASVALSLVVTKAASPRPVAVFDRDPGGLLLAWDHTGMGLFAADSLEEIQPDVCLDESVTLHQGMLAFSRPLHWIPASTASLPHRAEILLAAALVGLAEQACEFAVGYAKVRQQFGQPIGAFQAVKHRCADMAVRWRLAWRQTCLAALKFQSADEDLELQVASAKLLAAQAAHENARAAIQIHGAIGFQSECDVHWFAKRAHLYDQAGGSRAVQARRIATAGPAC